MRKGKFWLYQIPIYALVFLGAMYVALFTSKTATTISYQDNRHTVIIDAGHGGEDGGATSCTGILESQFNLEIALRLDKLMQLLGYKTLMIRTSDTAVHTSGNTIAARKASDLKARVKLVNETPNGVLVSIHQNYFAESKYSGSQVFYGKNEESKALAQKMQTSLREELQQGGNRQAKLAQEIYLMEHIQSPGILVECGFISNPEEEKKLREPEYQKQLCIVIAASLCDYFAS